MGWSTSLFCNVEFNRETYNSLYEVQDKLDEVNKGIKSCESTLRDLVVCQNPSIFVDKDSQDSPYWTMIRTFEENMELLEEYYIEKYKLLLLIDNWDNCHNKEGLAINTPDNVKWDSAFLEGDFVRTVKNPDANG